MTASTTMGVFCGSTTIHTVAPASYMASFTA